MTRLGLGLTVIVALAATVVGAQAPVPVAERVMTHGDTATRVTLFSNQVVVVTIREAGVQGFIRQITLPEDQYMIYLSILQTAAEELDEEPVSSDISTSHDAIELTLHIGPNAPRVVDFSPMATVALPLAKIMGALNDLEDQVRNASPSAAELSTWEPRRGDRVELRAGGYARVAEVLEDGVLVLEHESTYIREVGSADARDQVILHIVERTQ
jgi:hypothetical protein